MAGAIRTSDIKSRILQLAQTSVYQVTMQPPSTVLGYLSSEYGFNYGQSGEDVELQCSSASLPGSRLTTHEVVGDYHGVRERMAYRRQYDDTTDFTFYVDHDYKVLDMFDGWMDYISGIGGSERLSKRSAKSFAANNRMNYPNNYMTNVRIIKFEKDVSPNGRIFDDASFFLEYTFVQAFPLAVISQPVTYDNSEVLKVTVSMAYQRYTREKKRV